MSSKEAFHTLKDLFPQIDLRILKAVAFEHSKDIDGAVEFIISEVLPSFDTQRETLHEVPKFQEVFDTTNYDEQSKLDSPVEGGAEILTDHRMVESITIPDKFPLSSLHGAVNQEPENCLQSSSIHVENSESDGSASNIEYHVSHVKAPSISDSLFIMSVPNNFYVETTETEGKSFNQAGLLSQLHVSPSQVENEYGLVSSTLPSDSLISVEIDMPEDEFTDLSPHLTVATRSGQIAKTDMLEESINYAKTYKNTMVSIVESVLSLAKDVEGTENEAFLAKDEATKAGLDILSKVEDIKKMLLHAMEANHIHAGEVYGERSILATEAKELQNRLLHLADQKDKFLAVTNEMRETLEARLATAEAEKVAAEKVKLEKEENAARELTEQEIIMDRVVEESKRLKQEAEENSKLREFLLDRGRIVDMLQGELAVICEDVRLMKERVDKHLPIGGVTYSGWFPLASSNSSASNSETGSIVHTASAERPVQDDVPALASGPQTEFAGEASNIQIGSSMTPSDQVIASDDDWDFFEDAKELRPASLT